MKRSVSILLFIIGFARLLPIVAAQPSSQKITNNNNPAYYRVDSLNELAFELKRQNVDKALSLLNQAAKLAANLHYPQGEATSFLYEAGIYQQHGYDKRALLLYYKALELSVNGKDTFNIARANQQIGKALMENHQPEEAKKLFTAAMANYLHLKQPEDVINIKNYLGLINLEQQDFWPAEQYFSQALQESQALNYNYGIKKSNYNLGLFHLHKNNLKTAKTYFRTALALDKQKNDNYGLSLTQNQLSEVASREGKTAEAIAFATAALQNARVVSAIQLEIAAIKNLTTIYTKQGNYAKVAEWQKELIKHQEQLFEKERTYAMNFLDILKEKQEEQLVFEKQALEAKQEASVTYFILYLVVLGVVILALLAYIWYKNYHRARKHSQVLADKNKLIQKNASTLNSLNQAISKHNTSLEETNLLKNKLLSILSHDLRLPLVNTKGLLMALQQGYITGAETTPLLEELETQYVRSLTLLDNMLFWIKSQMLGGNIELKPTGLKVLLEDIIQEQEISLQEKNISIQNQIDSDLAVLGDKEMLKVIFRNLLSNSVKFTKTHGKVTINSEIKDAVLIQIQDEGVGMSKENLQKIKTRKYFTTRGTRNEVGSGFGLMICSDLVNQHGGDLLIESEPNKGSTFTIRLPFPKEN